MNMTWAISLAVVLAVTTILIIAIINQVDGAIAGSGFTILGGVAGYEVGKRKAR